MSNGRGWIGVDLDRTLAVYDIFRGNTHIGEPIPKMVNRVKRWLAEGWEVRIFTARVSKDGTPERDVLAEEARAAIRDWVHTHIGYDLGITCIKDYHMVELWDDRAVQVLPNTGMMMGVSPLGLEVPGEEDR